jgi:hypothetical protein
MRRFVLVVSTVALVLSAIGWIASAQEELLLPPGYIRSDLQLISQESKETWSSRWTGPIQAATILAWFYEHGYSSFLRDFNADGVIDELDTIELADILGHGLMRTETPVGTNDARLVIGLARYVADHYPDEFVLKIYDAGFPAEFAAEGAGTFAPDAIPGIELRLEGDPSIAAYELELETAEGVLVGLEENPDENNTYLSGRSYMFEPTPDGYTPVDLTWAEEDRVLPGHQGRVLDTVAMTDDDLYIDYRWGWTPAEFMLALSPVLTPEFASQPYGCPEDALAYHVNENVLGDYGRILIEECVLREGGFDIYIWIVTNVDFLWKGCGLCYFSVLNSGFTSVSHTGPGLWAFMETPFFWAWDAPLGSCGILPGQTAVFSVTVPAPTSDGPTMGIVGACEPPPPGPGGMLILELNGDGGPPYFKVETTGPQEMVEERCPDLAVRILDESCWFDRGIGKYVVDVVAQFINIGTAPTTGPFTALLESPSHFASDAKSILGTLGTTSPGNTVDVSFSFTFSPALPLCPVPYTVTADSTGAIAECNEDNNSIDDSVCCEDDGEPDGEDCPDLVIRILRDDCGYTPRQQVELTVTVEVENIGSASTWPTSPIIRLDCDEGSTTTVVSAVDPGPTNKRTATLTLSFYPTVGLPCPLAYTVEVDPYDLIAECPDEDPALNEDEGSVCCQ